MTRVTTATLQTFWDCRWSRPADRLGQAHPREGPSPSWVCIRAGGRRPVSDEECERCPYWEAADAIIERDERG